MMGKEITALTAFEMVKSEIGKWPQERVSYQDTPTRDGNFIRNVNHDEGFLIARVIMNNECQLLGVLYPKLILH